VFINHTQPRPGCRLSTTNLLLQVEEFVQQQTHQERRGPALQDLKDDDLFVVDKVGRPAHVPTPACSNSNCTSSSRASSMFCSTSSTWQ
jgi:hypothetical protein